MDYCESMGGGEKGRKKSQPKMYKKKKARHGTAHSGETVGIVTTWRFSSLVFSSFTSGASLELDVQWPLVLCALFHPALHFQYAVKLAEVYCLTFSLFASSGGATV